MKLFILSLLIGVFSTPQEESKKEIFELINIERVNEGLTPLEIDKTSVFFAEQHTTYMAQNKAISHDNFDHRAQRISNKEEATYIGENVARTTGTNSFLVGNWMKSKLHKKEILGDYTHTAIGIAEDENGVIYYTQIFIKK